MKVLKFPCPNQKLFAIRFKGHLIDCLEFTAQIFRDSDLVIQPGQKKNAKVVLALWALVEEDENVELDHQFIMVKSGEEFPTNVSGELNYVSSTDIQFDDGRSIELHLFHAGITKEFEDVDVSGASSG